MSETLTSQETKVPLMPSAEQTLEGSPLPDAGTVQVETERLPLGTAELPRGEALEQIYEWEISHDTPAASARVAGKNETPDLYVDDDLVGWRGKLKQSVVQLHQLYSKDAAHRASQNSWWNRVDYYAAHPGQPLNLTAKHNATIEIDGRPVDQGFEVLEFGDSVQDEQTLRTVFDTLALIDQFSGGLLAADPDRPRVVLMNNVEMVGNSGGGEVMGHAGQEAVVLNMRGIAMEAAKRGMNPKELLAVVLVHEMLGHSLEQRLEGGSGRYFRRYFDYSDEKEPGQLFDSVHAAIEPKQEAGVGSAPVREYGRVNAAEDLATSTDASVAEAMGWDRSMDKSERTKSTVDSYRRDLVMKLMNRAARHAAQYEGTAGIVGSELHYDTDENGVIMNVGPSRTLEISTISGEQAVTEEIAKVVARHRPPKELLVMIVPKI